VPARRRRPDLDDVLIGGRERRQIVIADYDDGWPKRFTSERHRIEQALGHHALRVEHIGSTAVPGLAAKPIIDVLVTVKNPDDDEQLISALTAAGYQLRVREPGHRMFRPPELDVHVHIWADTDPEVERYLALRDRLRVSASDRELYAGRKRELARRQWTDMNDYADAKSPVIADILARAAGDLVRGPNVSLGRERDRAEVEEFAQRGEVGDVGGVERERC
jgi:GrpB-like predicted nucleotidyltransferase (UPF0157 family)